MRAIVCSELGPADRLSVQEVPDSRPGLAEVVIDVVAAGLNFPDTLIIEGKYQVRPDLPFVPGGEASGLVSAV
ncbi:MAG: alcohol dehydrogenase catalytic domain-containing protein, partial [Acidimicrobiia bacterium]|nr:alcohol dehydrogenase catalytic domain-containing protein [Acidimicrobiia bacterium]